MEQLGDIIKMGTVVVGQGPTKKDKYLVLFPSTLLMLSVSNRLSAFIYEGKLPLSGLTIHKQEGETEVSKNSFEISGSLIETIHCSFPNRTEFQGWYDQLMGQIRASRQSAILPNKLSVQPLPPPHKTAAHSPLVSRSPRTGLASRGQGHGVQGWKMNCLRPAPPTRSFFQADKRNTLRRKEVEQSSYEDDLQILRVIEAYCTSKQRQTITNSAMLDSTPLLSLADEPASMEDSFISTSSSVMGLGNKRSTQDLGEKVERLEKEMSGLTRRLEQEVGVRKKLQDVLVQAGVCLPQDLLGGD